MKKNFIVFIWGVILSFRIDAGMILFQESNKNMDCNDTNAVRFTKREGAKECKNREIKKENFCYVSLLKECPKNYPLRGKDGSCYSCSETYGLEVENDCSVCENREIYKTLGGLKTCILKGCPTVAPLFYDGDCLPCYTQEILDISKEECLKCQGSGFDRRYVSKDEKIGKLMPQESGCYAEKDFWSHERKLYSISLGSENGMGALYEIWSDEIIRKNYIKNQHFYSCNDNSPIQTLPEICSRCRNRSYNYSTGECVLYNNSKGQVVDGLAAPIEE